MEAKKRESYRATIWRVLNSTDQPIPLDQLADECVKQNPPKRKDGRKLYVAIVRSLAKDGFLTLNVVVEKKV